MAILVFGAWANAQPTITIYTDESTYQLGDAVEVGLSAENRSEGMPVAVYVGLLTPGGGVYTTQYDGWSESLAPWIPDIYVPSGFVMGRTPFWSFNLPCSMPLISGEGAYCFVAALAHPGTGDWVSISYAPFTLGPQHESHYYVDGGNGSDSNDGSSDAPFKTITHALQSVNGSEALPATIHVAAGAYSASTNGETFPLNVKSWVSLSGDSAETTILDAEGAAYHVIFCDRVTDLTIEGFTIRGGRANGASGFDSIGAGILCVRNSTPTIRDNVLRGNESDHGGGAIYCTDSSVTLEDNAVEDNTSHGGGGAANCYLGSPRILNNTITGNWAASCGGGLCCSQGSPTIEGNLISGNTSQGELFAGGGIYCQDCTGSIRNNTVIENLSSDSGGGIAWWGSGAVTVEGNTVSDNVSNGRGGGLYFNSAVGAIVKDNTIENNSSDDVGGGIFCDGTSATIEGNAIVGNSSGGAGGAIMLWALAGPFTIADNTIEENTASAQGGGIFCLESFGAVTGNAITDNVAGSDGGGISCHGGLVDMEDNTVERNKTTAPGFGTGGGGISLNGCSPTIQNNMIDYNDGSSSGGGIFCAWYSSPRIQLNEISYNHAAYGGAVFVDLLSTPTIENNTMTGNVADKQGNDVYYETPPED